MTPEAVKTLHTPTQFKTVPEAARAIGFSGVLRAINTQDMLLKAAKEMRDEMAQILKEDGGCDHSVGICWCDYIRKLEAVDGAIAMAEPK